MFLWLLLVYLCEEHGLCTLVTTVSNCNIHTMNEAYVFVCALVLYTLLGILAKPCPGHLELLLCCHVQ